MPEHGLFFFLSDGSMRIDTPQEKYVFKLWLIRHGESANDNLTPMGFEQMRLASLRFKRLWDGAPALVVHSPTGRTHASARVFSQNTGLTSSVQPGLSIMHYHDREMHRKFAESILRVRTPNIVLIAHDETRRVCEAIVFRSFRRTDKPPHVPQGGILRFVEAHGYELV